MAFTVAVIRETAPGERRVAITPETCRKLRTAGATVLLQSGVGDSAYFPGASYEGAEFVADAEAVLQRADLLLCVQAPSADRLASLKQGAIVMGSLAAGADPAREAQWLARKATSFPLERLPRTTRAQAMDVLS